MRDGVLQRAGLCSRHGRKLPPISELGVLGDDRLGGAVPLEGLPQAFVEVDRRLVAEKPAGLLNVGLESRTSP